MSWKAWRDQVKVIQGHVGEANDRYNKGACLHGGALKVNPAPSVLSQHEYADYLSHFVDYIKWVKL